MFSWEISQPRTISPMLDTYMVFTFYSLGIFSPLCTLLSTLGRLHYSLQKAYKKVACQQNRSIQLHTKMILYCGKFQCALLPSFVLLHAILVNLLSFFSYWHCKGMSRYSMSIGPIKQAPTKFILMRVITALFISFSKQEYQMHATFSFPDYSVTMKVGLSFLRWFLGFIFFRFSFRLMSQAKSEFWQSNFSDIDHRFKNHFQPIITRKSYKNDVGKYVHVKIHLNCRHTFKTVWRDIYFWPK